MFQFEQNLQMDWYIYKTKSFQIPWKASYDQEYCCTLSKFRVIKKFALAEQKILMGPIQIKFVPNLLCKNIIGLCDGIK